MFLTGAIGIKIAIAKILGIADDVSELCSFLLNSKKCYTKSLTHLWLLLLMTLRAIYSTCCLLKVFLSWKRREKYLYHSWMWSISPFTFSDAFFSGWCPSNILLIQVVWKPVHANPGLKVNRSTNFSCIKMFFTAYVLCSLSLHVSSKLKDKQYKQKTSPKSYKLDWNQNFRQSWVSLIGLWTTRPWVLGGSVRVMCFPTNSCKAC